jgi:hypothetical protein
MAGVFDISGTSDAGKPKRAVKLSVGRVQPLINESGGGEAFRLPTSAIALFFRQFRRGQLSSSDDTLNLPNNGRPTISNFSG